MTNSYKKLIRNLRTKEYEKIRFIRNNAFIDNRKESKEGEVRQKKDSDLRKKRNG